MYVNVDFKYFSRAFAEIFSHKDAANIIIQCTFLVGKVPFIALHYYKLQLVHVGMYKSLYWKLLSSLR